jgi:hypothetical protein
MTPPRCCFAAQPQEHRSFCANGGKENSVINSKFAFFSISINYFFHPFIHCFLSKLNHKLLLHQVSFQKFLPTILTINEFFYLEKYKNL